MDGRELAAGCFDFFYNYFEIKSPKRNFYLKFLLIKNSESRRFSIKNAPLPARKRAFHLGKTIREITDAIIISAIITHNTIRIVFFLVIIQNQLNTKIKLFSDKSM